MADDANLQAKLLAEAPERVIYPPLTEGQIATRARMETNPYPRCAHEITHEERTGLRVSLKDCFER